MTIHVMTLTIKIWLEYSSTESACSLHSEGVQYIKNRPWFQHLNHWKSQSEKKALDTLQRLNTPDAQTPQIHSCMFEDHPVTNNWQRSCIHAGRNTLQRLSIPHMREIYWPSCLTGERLMSCWLGTHTLHTCVLRLCTMGFLTLQRHGFVLMFQPNDDLLHW